MDETISTLDLLEIEIRLDELQDNNSKSANLERNSLIRILERAIVVNPRSHLRVINKGEKL